MSLLAFSQWCQDCMAASHGWSSYPLVSGVMFPSRTPDITSVSKCLYGASLSGSSRCSFRHWSLVHFNRRICIQLTSPPLVFTIRGTWSLYFRGLPQTGQIGSSLLSTKNIFILIVRYRIIWYNNHGFKPWFQGRSCREGLWNPFFLYFIDSIMVISETIKCSIRLLIYSGNNSWGLNTSGFRADADVCSLLWTRTYEWGR